MLQLPFPPLQRSHDDSQSFTWAGEFRDRRRERSYLEDRREHIRRLLHIFGIAGTAVFFLLIGRDYLVHGTEPVFFWLATMRSAGLVTGIFYQLAVARAATAAMLQAVAVAGMMTLSLLVFATWILGMPPGLASATLAFALLLVFYLLLPVGVLGILANAGFLSIGTVVFAILHPETGPDHMFGIILFLLGGNAMGFVGMRQFNLDRRRNFVAREEALRVTEALTLARQENRRRSEYQAWALDALQVGVILFDPDQCLHTINRRALELLAIPPGIINTGDRYEILVRFLLQRGDFGDLGFSDIRFHVDRLVSGKAAVTASRLRSTGKILEFTMSRLPDNSIAAAISDATERHALNRRLRHAVEVAGDGFAIYDVNDRITVCSSRFAALYGLTADKATGMSHRELVQRAYERGVFDSAETGATSIRTASLTRRRIPERMIEIRTLTGEAFLVHERVTPSGDLVVLRTNITARRRIEDALRQSKEEAERALADLRDTQASLVLAEKMASLGSLVAGMSHEISTPLGIGVSAASHLSDEIGKLGERFRLDQLKRSDLEDFLDTATEATRIMQGNLGRATRLIQAFKQVSADQTTDELREFRVCEYLREIMLSLAPAFRHIEHRVDIDCPDDLVIRSRPGALGQIVTNLVMNALQHAFEGGERLALMTITVSQPRPGRVVIEFGDNGHGIPADSLPRVFDPFFTTRRGAGGTGLGLHIVYNLVSQVLGGTIAVSSRPGEGTRFIISFPQDIRS